MIISRNPNKPNFCFGSNAIESSYSALAKIGPRIEATPRAIPKQEKMSAGSCALVPAISFATLDQTEQIPLTAPKRRAKRKRRGRVEANPNPRKEVREQEKPIVAIIIE